MEIKSGLVSVVIVAHNNWPYLELAIQSALCQSYKPVEVIVVDNDSTDLTPVEVPKKFGDYVRYVRQQNTLDGGGYNTGKRLAAGEFIQFIDGDDFIAPNKIEKQLEEFRADPDIDIVYGDVRHFQSHAGTPRWLDWEGQEHRDVLARLLFFNGNGAGLLPHSVLYRRRVIERVGEWDESIKSSDLDYFLRAAWAGCRFKYCPGSLSFYRQRDGQMTADLFAMLRRTEATWAKALGYISVEPHRSTLTSNLARLRFLLALYRDGMTGRDGLAKLREARATDCKAISPLLYMIGLVLIYSPGSRLLVRSPKLHLIRSRVARLLHVT